MHNPPCGKKRSSGSYALKDPKVQPSQRVREFPDEKFAVNALGKLFCNACRETLSLKRSTLSNDIKSSKHVESKEKLKKKEVREVSIATALMKYDEKFNPKGQTLPDEHRVYRVKVMTAFLRAGIPITKLEYFCDILEENAYVLPKDTCLI